MSYLSTVSNCTISHDCFINIYIYDELYQLEKNNDSINFKEWLVKLLIHLEKRMKNITKKKRKKLRKLSGEGDIKELVSERFTEHLSLFNFFDDFSKYCEAFSPDITNIANLVTLGTRLMTQKIFQMYLKTLTK